MSQSNSKLKLFALSGILAPVIYVLALVIGNILDPTYSQIGRTVSELIQRGAPNRDLLNALFVVYNLLIIPFAVGLYMSLKKGWTSGIVLASLVIIGLLGVAWTLFFPLDEGGQSVSLTGMLHLIVGGLVVPFTFAFQLAFWRNATKDERWKKYGTFSLVIFVITLVFGLITVAFVNSDFRGLIERITIGSTLLWIEVLALRLYSLSTKQSTQS